MNIQKWLDDTAEAKAPPDATQTPDFSLFQRPKKPKPVFREKHAPKRLKSDSSLLDPQPHSHAAPPREPNPPIEGSAKVSAHSGISRPGRNDSTESESSSHRYARRPRRKTRLERYEPNSVKERGKHVHHSKRDESKKTKWKSKRKRSDKPSSGVAQNFHAKNVSRDRLTLKPREHLGIFNKGKTSTAIRGRGLPDLVFSEMKFLQKEQDQPEPAPQQGVPRKKRKKEHAHTKEGEISAFFTSVRPVLAEKDNNAQTKSAREDENAPTGVSRHRRAKSTKSSCVVPTVESPEKGSSLGFGSRGPRHESTSYVSWSESVRQPEVSPPPLGRGPGLDTDHEDPTCRVTRNTKDGEEEIFKRPTPLSLKESTRDTAERFVVSSALRSDSHDRASRSHSDPQHTSSLRKVNLVDRMAKYFSTDSADSLSSMPPAIPTRARADPRRCSPTSARPACRAHMTNASLPQQDIVDNKDVGSELVLQTSSDLGEVVRQCNDSFHEQRRANAPRRRHTELLEAPVDEQRGENFGPGANRLRVRFTELDTPSSVVPNFSRPSIYEQQAHRQRTSLQAPYCDDELWEVFYPVEQEYIDSLYGVPHGERDGDEYSGEPASYDLDIEARGYVEEKPLPSKDNVRHLASENSIVAAGFWRPNRLY